jgi:hypothetical protein
LKPFVETNCFLLPPGWERAIHHTHDRREILQDDWKLVCTRASNSNQIAIERGEQLMARSSFVRRTLLVASVLVASALPAVAQNAQVTGIVTARNQETGLLRTGVTDGTGEFRLPALPPGSYTLTAELQGFTTESQRDLVLVIGQTATVNLTLKPAVLAESITVTSSAPMVDTTRSDITTTVSSQQIQNLPLANTRWIAFALLTPGVSQDNIRSQYYSGTIDVGGGGASIRTLMSSMARTTHGRRWVSPGRNSQWTRFASSR